MNRRFERITGGKVEDNKTGKTFTCIIDQEFLDIINEICDENEKLVNINISLCQSIEEDMRCRQ